ncbi:hypothetical protein [Clostridium sp.]|uniref:hypothetical protein n=1 Tax=Clostridium sp. TaxID=1506 RepID=UPI00321806E2
MSKRNKLFLVSIIILFIVLSLFLFLVNKKIFNTQDGNYISDLVVDKNLEDPIHLINNSASTYSLEMLRDTKIQVELPNDKQIINIIDDQTLVIVSNDRKYIQTYNLKTKTTSNITEVSSNDKNIESVVYNDKWYLWAEDEAFITNTEAKPFQWKLIAYNIETNEKVTIDVSDISINTVKTPIYIHYTPEKFAISDTNKIVYCKNIDLNQTVGSQVVIYDLDEKTSTIVDQIPDTSKELITDCAIYNDSVLYCKFSEVNDDFSFRQTRYKYSDLYQYNIEEATSLQLTSKDFFCEPNIYENKISVIRMPSMESKFSCYAEMGIFDTIKKEYTSLVNRRSVISLYENQVDDIYVTNTKIKDDLLIWQDTSTGVRFLYDFSKDKFVEIQKGKPGYIVNISGIYKNHLTFVEVDKTTGEAKCFYIKYDTK